MQTRDKNSEVIINAGKIQSEVAATVPVEGLSETHSIGGKPFSSSLEPLLIYWAFCLAVGFLVLHDAILSWKIPDSWQKQPLFLVLAIVVTIASQAAYCLVARNGGRPFLPFRAILFILINGPIECFVFLASYQLLFDGAKLIFGNLNIVNVGFGILGFVFYSGFAHGFFWARLIPPHFSAEPRLQPLRRRLVPIQAAIVVVWCLYFYKTGDIWTPVILHMFMDAVLMVRVHPPVLMLRAKTHQ